jgi:predicted extracellular nuclease
MKKSLLTICLLTVLAPLAFAAPGTLFFSEYVEGGSYNKAVEIYNCTAGPVDLSAYELALYSNGSATATATVPLSGFLAVGDVFVVAHASILEPGLSAADLFSSGTINFNGDDAFALRLVADGTLVDVIGQIGFDPGSYWGVAPTKTQDATLRRKADVCTGDPNGSDAFDPAVEWDGYAKDDMSGLGAHSSNCGCDPVQNLQSTWGQMKSLYR